MHGEDLVAVGFKNPKGSQTLWISNNRLVEDELLAEGFSPYKQKYFGVMEELKRRYKHLKHWEVIYKDLVQEEEKK